jgi:hypothetical protein
MRFPLMKKWTSFLAGMVVISLLSNCKKTDPGTTGTTTRSFYMGVTPWPADFTSAELDTAYNFINQHCDIVSHHFDDGIPYDEAYKQQPMPTALQQEVQFRKAKTVTGKKILLSVAPLNLSRKQKADYYLKATVSDSIKNYWLAQSVNSQQVVNAYINYISYLIDQFNPNYVNYAVESNSLAWDANSFTAYKDFLSQVYPRLKTKYPGIPFFASFMVDESVAGLTNASQLLPYSDYIGLSAYPYITVSSANNGNTDPALFPAGYFERFINLDNSKPFLFAETGYIAKNLSIPNLQISKQGTTSWQNAFLDQICKLTNNHKGIMLIWFCSKDYDAGNATLQSMGLYTDIFGLWQDIGLKDANGAERPAYQTWLQWMAVNKN